MGAGIRVGSLEITPAILSLIAALDEFKGAWRAIGRIAPERLSALRRVATIESIGSSTRIEGAALNDREVERLLANLDVRAFASRDEEEVAGYAAVMETVFESADAIDLTENHIRQLHRDLLQFSRRDERHRGAWKTLPNHVEAIGPDGESLGIVFETATPRHASTDARARRLDAGRAFAARAAPSDRHRGLRRRLSRNTPLPGWQWSPVSNPDDVAAASGRIHVRSLRLAKVIARASSKRARRPTTSRFAGRKSPSDRASPIGRLG